MEKFSIENILKITHLEDEAALEKAIVWQGKLRWMSKENESLVPIRQHLRELIKTYEAAHWKNSEIVTDQQIAVSDDAQIAMESETLFVQKRKELIRGRLKKLGLNQQDLATLLNHRKNYMSELINGLRPFSKNDIIIMHRLLQIKLEDLMMPFIDEKTAIHIQQKIKELNYPHLRFNFDERSLEAR